MDISQLLSNPLVLMIAVAGGGLIKEAVVASIRAIVKKWRPDADKSPTKIDDALVAALDSVGEFLAKGDLKGALEALPKSTKK